MAQYEVSFRIDGSRLSAVEKKIKEALGGEVAARVSKYEIPSSRADRLSAAESQFEEAKSEVESLKDELQEWHDNMPEKIQSGSKASEIEDAISELEGLMDSMDSCDFGSVSFPGMF